MKKYTDKDLESYWNQQEEKNTGVISNKYPNVKSIKIKLEYVDYDNIRIDKKRDKRIFS